MSETSIEWTDVTWNPVRGCSRVSEGCRNCYAERMASRFSGQGKPFHGFADPSRSRMLKPRGHWTGRVELIPEKLDEPLRWRKPRRVFVNSMSDLFHEALPDEAIDRVFAVMALAPQHTFQILTKRPERMLAYMSGDARLAIAEAIELRHWAPETHDDFDARDVEPLEAWPLPNVWLGVSCEDQRTAEERIPLLLQTPAAVRFVSLEPLLGPIADLAGFLRRVCARCGVWADECVCEFAVRQFERGDRAARVAERGTRPGLDWVIVGGESGPGARPCDVAWVRSIRDQCKAAGVPCFVKQMGARVTGNHSGFSPARWFLDDGRVFVPPIIGPAAHSAPANAVAFGLGKAKGGDPAEWSSDLRVREFPR